MASSSYEDLVCSCALSSSSSQPSNSIAPPSLPSPPTLSHSESQSQSHLVAQSIKSACCLLLAPPPPARRPWSLLCLHLDSHTTLPIPKQTPPSLVPTRNSILSLLVPVLFAVLSTFLVSKLTPASLSIPICLLACWLATRPLLPNLHIAILPPNPLSP